MRVIAGTARGRRFEAPKGTSTRPTPDRVREALFSILYDRVSDARILDVFAGTGALAFEALSRGAERATLIESDPATALLVRKNAQALGFAARCDIITAKADKAISTLGKGGDRFDLVFLDPPYDAGLLEPTLQQLAHSPLLTPDVLIMAEHRSSSAPPPAPPTYAMEDTRRYGEVALAFYVRESES
jgi:16S rRNA (guanine966-N2)-methyltransferase